MAVTIDATNYNVIDSGDATTGWTSSMGGLGVSTISSREGGSNIEDQASEETFDVYFGISSADYSARTIFGWQKSGGPDTEANDGFSMYLGDGTNNVTYSVGGSDNFGFFFNGWSLFRLNVADRPTNFLTIDGTEASLDDTAVTRVGYGGNFPAKAAGNSNNVSFDQIAYVTNGNPAIIIGGGTTGDRGNFGEVTADDESTSNAYGIIRRLVPGSEAYEVNFGIEFGHATADTYFDADGFQLILNGAIADAGAGIAAGSMDVDLNGGTGTNLLAWANFVITGIGAVANFDFSDTAYETMTLNNGQFTDCGTFTFPPAGGTLREINNIIFNNCGAINFDSLPADGITINGSTNANGAWLWSTTPADQAAQDNVTLVSDGSGHGVYINLNTASLTTYNLDGLNESGYAVSDGSTGDEFFLVDNALDGDVTINLSDSVGNHSVMLAAGYTGTVTINNSVTITVTDLNNGSEVRVYLNGTGGGGAPQTEVAGIESSTGGQFQFAVGSGVGVDIVIIDVDSADGGVASVPRRTENVSFTASQDFPAGQRTNDNYENPA